MANATISSRKFGGATLTLLLMSISATIQLAYSMASGAPTMACVNLRPLHGFHMAKPASASQFFISQSALSYKLGENITVDLVTDSSERQFRGFIVQAYDPSSGQPIGQFVSNENARSIESCSSATHRSSQPKKRVTIFWSSNDKSREQNHHQVRFRASIVVSYSEFYTGFESSDQLFDKFGFANRNSSRTQ